MKKNFSEMFAAAIAMGLGAAGLQAHSTYDGLRIRTTVDPIQKAITTAPVSSPEERADWLKHRRTMRRAGYGRPGWSVKQGQRMASKRRNRATNRAAHRG